MPFVRQFRLADPPAFDALADLPALQHWLGRCLQGPKLAAVMAAPWSGRSPWRSPRWLYHLALREEWQAARADGLYSRSTRGLALEEVGFIHLSEAHQVPATAARFYADVPAPDLILLTLDPQQLANAGLTVRRELADLRHQSDTFKAQWETEKEGIKKIQGLVVMLTIHLPLLWILRKYVKLLVLKISL